MERKVIHGSVAKAVTGRFAARVYVVDGPPDADGDVIKRGAIEDGAAVKVSVEGHDTLTGNFEPAGAATLRHVGRAVHAEGHTFDNARGAALRAALAANGAAQEWSVGFEVKLSRTPTAAELKEYPDIRRVIHAWRIVEISPVVRGACGPTCRTLDAKCAPGVCKACEEQAVLQSMYERIKRAAPYVEVSAPSAPAWSPFVEWLGEQFAIPRSQRPVVKWFHPRGTWDGRWGWYDGDNGTVWVRRDLGAAETLRTLAHEHAHHYEACQGWLHSEGFAHLMEDKLVAEWSARRAA